MATYVVFQVPTDSAIDPQPVTAWVTEATDGLDAINGLVEQRIVTAGTVYACDLAETTSFSVVSSVVPGSDGPPPLSTA